MRIIPTNLWPSSITIFKKKDFHKIWRLFICAEGLVPYFSLSGSTNQCRQSLWNVLLWLLHPTTMHEKNSNDFWFKISIICHKKEKPFFSLSLSHLWPTRLRVIYYIQQLILVQNSSPTYIHTMRRGAIYMKLTTIQKPSATAIWLIT